MIDCQTEMSGYDSHEKDESDSQWYAFDMELTKRKTQSTYQGKDDDALHRRMYVD